MTTRFTENEIKNAGWTFKGVSKNKENVYYSPDGTKRFSIYPSSIYGDVVKNNLYFKMTDKILAK